MIFETNPCYDEKIAALTQAGGGMTIDDVGSLYFGVGDFGGMENAQAPDHSYGKIYYYNPPKDVVETFAIGTRNPQGLSWSGGALYESEHGPKGGDELNVVTRGDNLGWPVDSYGAAYNRDIYDEEPLDVGHAWGRVTVGKAPAFAFVPAIAPSGIALYPKGKHFRLWADDLIVAGIGARSIYRVRMNEAHGVYAEPLANLGDRVRFVQVSPAGSIIVKADPNILIEIRRSARPAMSGTPIAYTEAQIARGKRTFSDQCASCHGGNLEGATGSPLAGSGSHAHTVGSMNGSVRRMPLTAPGSLSDQQYADILAYILKSNCHPSNGKGELTAATTAEVSEQPVMRGKCF